MTSLKILSLVTASLLIPAAALAQMSSGGTSGGTSSSGMSSPSGGVSSPSASPTTAAPGIASPSATTGITSPTPAPTAMPGAQTTGPGAASSAGGSNARSNGTCPPGNMTDYSVGPNDPGRCKPASGVAGSASSSSAGQPASIMAPPTTSGAR